MNPHFHTDFSISDSLIFVRKSVLIYETIINILDGLLRLCDKAECLKADILYEGI